MRRAPIALVPLALALAACGPESAQEERRFAEPASSGVTVCPSGATVAGIDVSSYQGTINWAAASDGGVQFAIAKATEGLTIQDADFANNWSQMKANGVIRGAYHFFHPQDDGAAQADDYLKMVGTLGEAGDLPPLLDWEYTDPGISTATTISEAQEFIDEIKSKTGLDTIIYTYPSYWEGLGSPAQFAIHPLWLATYTGSTSTCPTELAPWTSYAIWQWAGSVTTSPYPGVSGEDLNLFNGSYDQLRGWSTPPIAQSSGNEALTAVDWPDQHVEIFGRSPAGEAIHLATGGSGDSWSTTDSLGGGVECGSAAAFWGAPGLYPELFSPLAGGAAGDFLWSGNSWDPEQPFGGASLSDLSTAVGMDGQARVFALGADGAIWIDAWNQTSQAFSGWSSLGGSFATGASAITWGNGTIELFATDSSGGLWHINTSVSASSGWSAWAQLGTGIASRPVAVRWADGTVGHAEVFARGTDQHLYHLEYSLQSGWPAPSVLSASNEIIGVPSAYMNPPGAAQSGPEVVARDSTGLVLHMARSGSGYTSFAALGEQLAASDPFGWIRGDGTAEVFAVDLSGNLVRTRRDSSGTWSGWSAIGAGFDSCAPALPSADGGTDAGSSEDGGALDAGIGDAGLDDAGNDAGPGDAGVDAGPVDAGVDAGLDGGGAGEDAGTRDGGADGGALDAGARDGGTHGGGSDAGPLSPAPSGGCSGGPAGPGALAGVALAMLLSKKRRARLLR